MAERILTLAQVVEEKIVPLSKSSLYRLAEDPDSPFWKRGGRWLTVESDLVRWVRAGGKGSRRSSGDPMPTPKRDRLMDRVLEIREKTV